MSGKAAIRMSFIDRQIAQINKAIVMYNSEIAKLVNDKYKLISEKRDLKVADETNCHDEIRDFTQQLGGY